MKWKKKRREKETFSMKMESLERKKMFFIVEKKSYLRCVIGALRKVELLFAVE